MRPDPLALALSALQRFSSSPAVHRLGLYRPAQRLARAVVREGFRVGTEAGRRFTAARALARPERVGPASPGDLFDLNLTEEQQLARELAQRFANEVLRPAAHDADAACAPPADFYTRLDELALSALAVPSALGGAATEASVVTHALVAEDLARGDAGLAVAALAPLAAAHALSRWGSADQQARYLTPFVEPTPPRAALAICEPRPLFDPTALSTRARADGAGFVLTGEKSLVPLVGGAALFLVAANLEGKGPRVFVVEADAAGLTATREPAMGLRAAGLGRVTFDEVRLPERALLGDAFGSVDFMQLIDLARTATSALTVGVAQAVLDYTIAYANERHAFGEPISHRQAVAFMIADVGVELEGMRLLTWRAAARAEQGLSFHREAFLARALCADKGVEIGTHGVQLLGGHGFIKDHPVERWYRDLMTLSVMEGGLSL